MSSIRELQFMEERTRLLQQVGSLKKRLRKFSKQKWNTLITGKFNDQLKNEVGFYRGQINEAKAIINKLSPKLIAKHAKITLKEANHLINCLNDYYGSAKPMRYDMWAGIGIEAWNFSGRIKSALKEHFNTLWPIVDNETCGVIEGSPRMDQYMCFCASNEDCHKIWAALNGLKETSQWHIKRDKERIKESDVKKASYWKDKKKKK